METTVAASESGATSESRVHRLSPRLVICAICVAVTAADVGLYFGLLRGAAPDHASGPVLFVTLAALFGLAEVFVVHLHFRSNAHSFSLLELPLVAGLFFAQPLVLILGQLCGAGLALKLHRKQPTLKLAFNLCTMALETSVAIAIFRLSHARVPDASPLAWLNTFLATLVASALAVVLIHLAISISEGTWRVSTIVQPMAFGLTATSFTTSLGLLAVINFKQQPVSVLLLALPIVGVYLASWAYTTESRRRSSLDFVYRSTNALHNSPDFEAAIAEMLRPARDAFRTATAELYYSPVGSGEVFRSTVGPGDSVETLQRVAPQLGGPLLERLHDGQLEVRLAEAGAEEPYGSLLAARGLHEAIIAPMNGEHQQLGILVLADRLSDVARFGPADLRLAGTLANHLGMSLENGRLEQSLQSLVELKNELAYQAFHDPLTKLANRALFHEKVRETFESRKQQQSALILIDLDDFKLVNDSLGHLAGDQVLKTVAERLGDAIQTSGTVARLGGDEFAIFLPHCREEELLGGLAGALLFDLTRPAIIEDVPMPIHATFGIALGSGAGEPAELLRNADIAMYAAKARGKHTYAIYDPAMHDAALERYNLTADLRDAPGRDEFVLYYQPFVDLRTGMTVGAEALIRWNHPSRGLLPPSEFIGLAEESGTIVAITRRLVEMACAFLARLDREGCANLFISVNITIRDLQPLDFAAYVLNCLMSSGAEPSKLVLELTEGMTFPAWSGERIRALRATGARLALDDFGTGYSSLSQLSHLPIDVIKIAKPFVDDLALDSASSALAGTVVELTRKLKMTSLAEGVETESQLAALQELGCDIGQGYLFARPMPESDFLAWLKEQAPGARVCQADCAGDPKAA